MLRCGRPYWQPLSQYQSPSQSFFLAFPRNTRAMRESEDQSLVVLFQEARRSSRPAGLTSRSWSLEILAEVLECNIMHPVLQSTEERCNSLVTAVFFSTLSPLLMSDIDPDSAPNPDVSSNSSISIIPLRQPPRSWQTTNKLLFLIFAPLKVLFQMGSLWYVLGYRTNPSRWMIVQVGRQHPLSRNILFDLLLDVFFFHL
jgi:hypothetical protein